MGQSIAEILAADNSAYVRVVTARLPRIRAELREEHERLEALLPELRKDDTVDGHPDLRATLDRIAEIEEQIAGDVIALRLRGIGHRAWADLLRKHPPTRAQLSDDRRADHNPETFPVAAIAASLDPASTEDEVARLVAQEWFNEECWNELWSACLRANVVDPAPKSLAASIHRRKGESSRRPTISESPAASSSEES